MSVLYNKNGVYIDDDPPATLRFGSYVLPTQSSNRGGDTILRGNKGFHDVYAKSEGIFSSKYSIVISYYSPPGAPDEIVWVAKDRQEADEIVAAVKSVLG